MPNTSLIEKIYRVLKFLKKKLSKPSNINLVSTLKDNHIPHDYSKIMMKMGLLIKVSGGTRGPASYVWNKDIPLTKEIVIQLIHSYNELRRNQKEKKFMLRPKISIETRLSEIDEKLVKLLNFFIANKE